MKNDIVTKINFCIDYYNKDNEFVDSSGGFDHSKIEDNRKFLHDMLDEFLNNAITHNDSVIFSLTKEIKDS